VRECASGRMTVMETRVPVGTSLPSVANAALMLSAVPSHAVLTDRHAPFARELRHAITSVVPSRATAADLVGRPFIARRAATS
jgi:hypothetical protein